jgi:hypothetical protein
MSWLPSLTNVAERLSGPVTFNLLTPLIPGGVLVLGGIALRCDWRGSLSVFPKIFGEATLAILVIFAAYLAGMLLIYVVNAASELLGYMLGYALGAKFAFDPLGTYQSTDETWRRAASIFLGPELAPASVERGMDDDVYNSLMKDIETIEDSSARFKKCGELLDKHASGKRIDWSWQQWYWALDQLFPRPHQAFRMDYDLSRSVQSCGWAGIILLIYAPRTHWLLWLVFGAAVVSGVVFQVLIASTSATSKNSATAFQLASMLRELRSRNQAQRP